MLFRSESEGYGYFIKVQLDSESEAIHIPSNFALGYQVTSPTAHVMYLANNNYCRYCDCGFNYSILGSLWPISDRILSERDINLPEFSNFTYRDERCSM